MNMFAWGMGPWVVQLRRMWLIHNNSTWRHYAITTTQLIDGWKHGRLRNLSRKYDSTYFERGKYLSIMAFHMIHVSHNLVIRNHVAHMIAIPLVCLGRVVGLVDKHARIEHIAQYCHIRFSNDAYWFEHGKAFRLHYMALIIRRDIVTVRSHSLVLFVQHHRFCVM